AIRSSSQFHLQHAEIDPQLQFLTASSPAILRTLILPFSCGQSFRMELRSKLIVTKHRTLKVALSINGSGPAITGGRPSWSEFVTCWSVGAQLTKLRHDFSACGDLLASTFELL